MSAPSFILGLQERGATLQLEGEALRVTPAALLTDADLVAWREHKREIIALLETASQADAQSPLQQNDADRDAEIIEAARAAHELRVGEPLPPGLVPYGAATAESYARRYAETHDETGAEYSAPEYSTVDPRGFVVACLDW